MSGQDDDGTAYGVAEALDLVRHRRDPTTLIHLWLAMGRAKRHYPDFDMTPALDQLSDYVGNAPTVAYRDERMRALVFELAKRCAERIAPAGAEPAEGRPTADDASAPLYMRLLAACVAGNEVYARTLIDTESGKVPGRGVLASLGPVFEALSHWLFQGRPCDQPHRFLGELVDNGFVGSARPGA